MKLLKGLLQRLKEWDRKDSEERRRIYAMPFWQGCCASAKRALRFYFWVFVYCFPFALILSIICVYYGITPFDLIGLKGK